MDLVRPADLDEALAARAARPDALALRGGTDVMVELNLDKTRPDALLDLGRVRALDGWTADGGRVRLGAALTHGEVVAELGALLPAVAAAARATARRRSATAPRWAATSAPRRPAATSCARCSRPAPRSSWARCCARAASRWRSS